MAQWNKKSGKANRVEVKELFPNKESYETILIPEYLKENESFIIALGATLFEEELEHWREAESFNELHSYLQARNYAIYSNSYVVVLSEGMLKMFVSGGWKKMNPILGLQLLDNWKIYG